MRKIIKIISVTMCLLVLCACSNISKSDIKAAEDALAFAECCGGIDNTIDFLRDIIENKEDFDAEYADELISELYDCSYAWSDMENALDGFLRKLNPGGYGS